MTSLSKLYLAGPMTGVPGYNYPAFNGEAARLRALGWVVENPAENAAPVPATWAMYLRQGIRQMLSCDAIAVLPGWGQSKGAMLEVQVAMNVGMKFFEAHKITDGPAHA